MMCDCPCQKRLPGTGWTIEQDTLGLRDTKSLENFRMLDRKLDDLLDLFNLKEGFGFGVRLNINFNSKHEVKN